MAPREPRCVEPRSTPLPYPLHLHRRDKTTAFLQALPQLLERDLARVTDPSGAIDFARAAKVLPKDLFDHVKQHAGAPTASIAASYAKAVAADVTKAAG